VGDITASRQRLSSDGNVDDLFIFSLAGEMDLAGYLGEQSMVFPHPNVGARENSGPPLAGNDAPGGDQLASVSFHSQSLSV